MIDSYRQTLHDGIDRARYVERCAVKNCGPPWMRIASIIRLCSYLICTHRECYSTVNTLEVFARFSHHAIRPKERHHVRYVKRTSYLSLQSSSLQPPGRILNRSRAAQCGRLYSSLYWRFNEPTSDVIIPYIFPWPTWCKLYTKTDWLQNLYFIYFFLSPGHDFFVYDFTKGFGWGAYELEIWMWWVFARA